MTPYTFAQFVRDQTDTDTTTFPDSKLLLYMNIVQDDLVKDLAETNEDIFGMYAYRNLVADQREYSLPENMLNNMKYLEIDIKGTGKYVKGTELDLNQYQRSTDEAVIRRIFSYQTPRFDLFRESIFWFTGDPIINVENGMRCWYIRYPDHVTDLSNDSADLSNNLVHPISAGIPRQLHLVWATKVIVMFKTKRDIPLPLTADEKNVEYEYAKVFKAVTGMNLDRSYIATRPRQQDGYNY